MPPLVKWTSVAVRAVGAKTGAIHIDFTGTRRKSRVRYQAECLGLIRNRVRSRQLARKGRGDVRSGLCVWLGIDTFAPFPFGVSVLSP